MATTEKKNVALVIGRWQFPHNGHLYLFTEALKVAERVIVVIGSAHQSRNPRNPFTWSERRDMILCALPEADRARVSFLPVRDYYNDDRWNAFVSKAVAERTKHGESITLVGHKKDHTSYYLANFPNWAMHSVTPIADIDATPLRNIYFGPGSAESAQVILKDYAPAEVLDYLVSWRQLPAYAKMQQEFKEVGDCRTTMTDPFYLTSNAVIKCSGKILLVRRSSEVGTGLWTLPGAFLKPYERFVSAGIRGLKEESGFSVLQTTMQAAFRRSVVFDHPLRSARGRIVSQASFYDYGGMPCPEVFGNGDVDAAQWFTPEEIKAMEAQIFEDNTMVIDEFVHLYD